MACAERGGVENGGGVGGGGSNQLPPADGAAVAATATWQPGNIPYLDHEFVVAALRFQSCSLLRQTERNNAKLVREDSQGWL